ncbi:MAG: SDR family oxidoreductase [bacterium]
MDEKPFANTTALVTGAGHRLGRVMALRLGALGARVVVHHGKSSSAAVDVCARLHRMGVEAVPVQADLSEPKQAETLVERARKAAGGPLRFLINNAADFPKAKLEKLEWDELAESLRIDAWAPLALTRAFAAQVERPADHDEHTPLGAVVNILDARIADYDWEHAGYHLAKRMLADLTQLCAVRFAPDVTVNGVAPGPILPPPGEGKATLERWAKHLPLQRTPTPDDVADAALFLLGARSVTGQVVYVDSGRHLGRAVYA